MEQSFTFTQKEIDEGKVLAGISYFGLIGFLIGYLAGKENRFTLYHAQQGLVLAIALLLSVIPIIGWIWSLACLVLFVMGIINGFSGQVKPLPIIGSLGFKVGLLKADQPAAPQA